MGNRFITPGVSCVWWTPSVANLGAPTRAELDAGTVLTEPSDDSVPMGWMDSTGFTTDADTVDVPAAASRFTNQIPGRQSAKSPSITFYDDQAGSGAVRTSLAEGTEGVLVIAKYGDVEDARCETWPARVNVVKDSMVVSKAEPATFTVEFAIKSSPHKDAVVPAAA